MKTNNQQMIQQLMDEGEYAPSYPFVTQSKLSDFQKLLITQMLNDIRMNGVITWKHETYASKLNKTRQGILKQFKELINIGVLIPSENNHPGGKRNTFIISFNTIEEYSPVNGQNRKSPVNVEPSPVNVEISPVNVEISPVNVEPSPVNGGRHTKKSKEIEKEITKERLKTDDYVITDIPSFFVNNDIKNSNAEFLNQRKPADKELQEFLNELDI